MLLTALFWAAVSSAPPAARPAEDLPALTARGTLRVIFVRQSMPEAVSIELGAPPGLEREMIEGFGALQRLKVEFVAVPAGVDRIPAFLAGKGDVIAGGFGITDERRKAVDFTAEVFPARHVVVTRLPHARIDTLDELRRVRVGTMKASSRAEEIAAAGVPPGHVDDSFAAAVDVVKGLRAGRVAAIVMGSGAALLETRKDPQLQLGLFLGPSVGRCTPGAFASDAPLLRQALDEYVTNFRRTSTWNRLVVKSYGELALEVLKNARGGP